MTPRLDTIIIFTTGPLEVLVDFYRAVFAMPEFSHHGEVHAGVSLGDIYFGIDRVDDVTVTGGGVSLWFHMPDVQETFDRAVAAGATVRYPPERKPMGDVLASFRDPDGNIVGVVSRS